MLLFLKQKIVLGFLLSVFSFFSSANVFSMELSKNKKIKEDLAEQNALVFYETILNKVTPAKKVSDAIQEKETKKQILELAESAIFDSLNSDLAKLVETQKFFESFVNGLVNKIIGILELVYINVDSKSLKLSEVIKLDDCDKINLAIFLMQSIQNALKPSGLIRLDHEQIKKACKQCGKLTCVCCVGSCVCITCVGVVCQHPEVMQSFIKDFPKCSVCIFGTGLTCGFDKCFCGGYFFKEFCSAVKNMMGGIKCWFCGCCDNDDNKDFKV